MSACSQRRAGDGTPQGNKVPAWMALVWAVTFAVAYLAFLWLARRAGINVVAAVGLASAAAAWVAHTDRSAAMAEDVSRALNDIGMTRDQAARELDEAASHFSAQLAGTRMLSLWRLAGLPDAFLIAFAKRILTRYAPGLIVIERGEVCELITTVRALRKEAEAA